MAPKFKLTSRWKSLNFELVIFSMSVPRINRNFNMGKFPTRPFGNVFNRPPKTRNATSFGSFLNFESDKLVKSANLISSWIAFPLIVDPILNQSFKVVFPGHVTILPFAWQLHFLGQFDEGEFGEAVSNETRASRKIDFLIHIAVDRIRCMKCRNRESDFSVGY